MFCIVKEQPDFAIDVGQVNFLETNNVLMPQLTQQLHNGTQSHSAPTILSNSNLHYKIRLKHVNKLVAFKL